MKIRIFSPYFILGFLAAATFSQEAHLIKDAEVPLDDFPLMMAGFRIQIGAFSSENTAVELKQSLQEEFGQIAHLNFGDGLWRIRLGDFADTLACREFMASHVIPAGYSDAIIIEDMLPGASVTVSPPQAEPGFRIQIAALSDRDSAIKSAKDMACNFPDLRAHVMMADSLYKIQFGDFRLKSEAEEWRTEFEQIDSLQAIVVPAQVYGSNPPLPSQRSPENDIFQYDD